MEAAERLYAIRRSALARGDMSLAGEVELALLSLGVPFHDDPPEVIMEAAVPAKPQSAAAPSAQAAVPPKPRRGRPPKAKSE